MATKRSTIISAWARCTECNWHFEVDKNKIVRRKAMYHNAYHGHKVMLYQTSEYQHCISKKSKVSQSLYRMKAGNECIKELK